MIPSFLLRPRAARDALRVLIAAMALACASPPAEDPLPAASASVAEPEGLSGFSRWAIDRVLGWSAWRGNRSGYVAMFARDGRVVHTVTKGYADVASETPMQLDTRFRMASMTKPVTAVAAMILVQEGGLSLDEEVARFIPEFENARVATSPERNGSGEFDTVPLERPITVRDLITFRVGMGYGDPEGNDLQQHWDVNDPYEGPGSLEARIAKLPELPFHEQPGQRWRYGHAADVLARVVEVAAAQPFGAFLEERLFAPLGMTSTSFLPPSDQWDGMATVYTQDEGGDLVAVEAPNIDAPDWTPGGSGLVSTAPDYMRFALMLWNRGTYDGVQILRPETVDDIVTPHVPDGVLTDADFTGLGWGLGMAVVVDEEGTPVSDRNGDFWWAGYYGTTFFVSPSTGLVAVQLTQNQPGPHSGLPLAVYIAQALAFSGL